MKRIAIAIASLAALAGTPALADSAAKPDKAAACAACHGDNGVSPQPQLYPSLAGQYTNYLEHALKEYRSGVRKNPVMTGQAASLTDHDIEALAAYFAGQPGPLYTPSVKAQK